MEKYGFFNSAEDEIPKWEEIGLKRYKSILAGLDTYINENLNYANIGK